MLVLIGRFMWALGKLWLRLTNPKEYIFSTMGYRVWSAYCYGDYETASKLAVEYLNMAPDFPKSWFCDVAKYDGHQILGLVQLHQQNTSLAIEHLLLSSATPKEVTVGHPSFRFILAYELVKAGEQKVVIKFLTDLRNQKIGKDFPEKYKHSQYKKLLDLHKKDRRALLAAWIKTIQEGNLPDDPRWRIKAA